MTPYSGPTLKAGESNYSYFLRCDVAATASFKFSALSRPILVPGTGFHRQARILVELLVRERPFAQQELGTSSGGYRPRVKASGTKTRVFGIENGCHSHSLLKFCPEPYLPEYPVVELRYVPEDDRNKGRHEGSPKRHKQPENCDRILLSNRIDALTMPRFLCTFNAGAGCGSSARTTGASRDACNSGARLSIPALTGWERCSPAPLKVWPTAQFRVRWPPDALPGSGRTRTALFHGREPGQCPGSRCSRE